MKKTKKVQPGTPMQGVGKNQGLKKQKSNLYDKKNKKIFED